MSDLERTRDEVDLLIDADNTPDGDRIAHQGANDER